MLNAFSRDIRSIRAYENIGVHSGAPLLSEHFSKVTVLTMFFFGWVLVISAAIEVAQAFMVGAWVGFLVHALSAVLFGVIGLLLITRPLLAAEVATLLMAAFFLIS